MLFVFTSDLLPCKAQRKKEIKLIYFLLDDLEVVYTSATDVVISSLPSGVTPGTYGSTTAIPSVTVDTYGRTTAITTNALPDIHSSSYTPTWTWITGGSASVTDLDAFYIQVGNFVTVHFKIAGMVTTASSASGSISLPVPPIIDFTSNKCIGSGTLNTTTATAYCHIAAVSGTKNSQVLIITSAASFSGVIKGSFAYRIQ